jgi:hypothetical protein
MPRFEPKHLQLPPRYLAMVRDILQNHLPQAEVWAYGSRVMGGCYEASDLDLVARRPDDLSQPIHDEIEAGYVVVKEGK